MKKFIEGFKRARIESTIRKNCGSWYSVDTCVILYGLGYPRRTEIKNFREFLEKAPITVYNFILNETLTKINRDLKWQEVEEIISNQKPPEYLIGIKSRLKEKLDRPEVRIVDDARLYKTDFFKELNQELFENLCHQKISLNDKKFLIASSYENNKIVSVDEFICRLASKYRLNYLETRTITKLPVKIEFLEAEI
jgi:hypothetical protein